MKFPSVRSQTNTNGTTATTTPVVNLPASVSAGDTLLVVIRNAAAGAIGWPGGAGVWNELVDASPDGSVGQTAVAWKKADGTEGGTTITLSSGNGKFASIAYAIQDAIDPTVQAPEISTVAVGTTGEPDASAVTPTGGSKNYLYLTFFTMEGEQTGITAYPSNYTLGQSGLANSGTGGAVTTNATVAGAARQKGLNTAGSSSDDAGVWDVTGTLDDSSAYTVAFHPAPLPVGQLAMTGLAAAAVIGLNIFTGLGSLPFSGYAPTVVEAPPGIEIAIPAGSLRYTGQDVGVSFTGPDAGRLSFTGLAPTALNGRTVDVPAGSVSFTGYASTIDSSVAIPVGSLLLVGYAPALTTDAVVGIPVGNLVFSGYALGHDFGIQLPAGQLQWIGYSSGSGFEIMTPSGALTLVGLAPTIGAGGDNPISVPAGSLLLVGQDIGVSFAGPDVGRLWFTGYAPTPSIGPVIDIPSGVLSFAGLALVTSTDVGVPIPAGTIVLAGYAPSISGALAIDVPVGALTLAGYSFTLDYALPVSVGALTFSGQSLVLDYTLPVPAGSLAFTGYVPTVTEAQQGVINIPAGSLAWAGRDVGVSFTGPDVGRIALTGYVPVPSIGSGGGSAIDVPSGAIVFAGLAPTPQISGQFIIPVPAGSLVFTGLTPTSNTGKVIDIPVGQLVLTGRYIAIVFIVPNPGQIIFTGYAPALQISGQTNISIPAGALRFTGQIPSVSTAIPVGVLSFIGYAPSIGQGPSIPAGQLVFAGLTPAPSTGSIIDIPAGQLLWTGFTPSLGGNTNITIPTGTLVFSGHALNVGGSTNFVVPAGQLQFVGLALELDKGVQLGVGVVTFTGYTNAFDHGIGIPAGQIVFVGYAGEGLNPTIINLTGSYVTEINLTGVYRGIVIDIIGEKI